jgi:hypothetical protein
MERTEDIGVFGVEMVQGRRRLVGSVYDFQRLLDGSDQSPAHSMCQFSLVE